MVPTCAVRSWMSSDIVSAVRSEGRAAHLGALYPCCSCCAVVHGGSVLELLCPAAPLWFCWCSRLGRWGVLGCGALWCPL